MSERVMIEIAESAMLIIDITDRMTSDYRECKNQSEKIDCDGKDCHSCSLNTSEGFDFGLCELSVVVEAIERRGDNE